MNWTEILSATALEDLFKLYSSFHDSCIREIHISTGEFVDEKCAMHFDNELTAIILFQRQFKENPVLELKFTGGVRMNYQPLEAGGVIYDATLKYENEMFYWADFESWDIEDFTAGDFDSTWICGRRIFWRFRPDMAGNTNRLEN